MVVGRITRVAIPDLARRVRERFPDRGAAPILGGRALNLVSRRGAASEESVREPVIVRAGITTCFGDP